MKTIDINCDLGESFGAYKIGQDEQVMPYISSCNIACGFHAGDPATIERTILLAIHYKVAIGAHPSFPDLSGFGRRYMDIPVKELISIIKYQVAAMKSLVESHNEKLVHVKPHGALYNAATQNEAVAKAIIQAVAAIDDTLLLLGPAANPMAQLAAEKGLRYIAEAFTDRMYTDDLQLVSRTVAGAVLEGTQFALMQALQIAKYQKVKTHSGTEKSICAETLCIHGDRPEAAALAKALHEALTKEGFTIKSPYYE